MTRYVFQGAFGERLTELSEVYQTVVITVYNTKNILCVGQKLLFYIIRALRSRSLRDGSLSHKGRFATFVRSYWTPQRITHKYVKPVNSKLHVLN